MAEQILLYGERRPVRVRLVRCALQTRPRDPSARLDAQTFVIWGGREAPSTTRPRTRYARPLTSPATT